MSTLFDTATPHPAGYRDVEARSLAAAPRDDLTLLDVREPHELDGLLGHIAGVRLAPLATVRDVVGAWPRQTQVVLVCRSGARSANAAAQLVALGFTRVMNLRGGMLTWNTEQLPVVRTHPAPLPSLATVRDRLLQGLPPLLTAAPGTSVAADALRAGASPSREALSAVLDALQAARPAAIQDTAAFEHLLRSLRDQLAVARSEGDC